MTTPIQTDGARIEYRGHTPGPWTLSGSTYPILVRSNDAISVVAQIGGHPMSVESDDESQANARLIASAPALVEALQLIATDTYENGNPTLAAQDAISALRKAGI